MSLYKVIKVLILGLLPFFALAQVPVPRGPATVLERDARLQGYLNLVAPRYADTTAANTQKGLDSLASIIYTDHDTCFFYRGKNSVGTICWIKFGTGTAGGGGTTYTADEVGIHLSGNQFQIKSTYPGQTSITTLGIINTGTWQSTAIQDPYISSAAAWNAKLTSVLNSAKIFVGNGSNIATAVTAAGDITNDNAGNFTLASVVGAGSCTSCDLTVDSKGRITAKSNGGGGGGAPFNDNVALVQNNSDNTRKIILDASLITTLTTRTLKSPDANGTLVLNDNTATLTNKTIAAGSNTITGLTNSNLSGSAAISNANLANSAITINGVSTSLGGSTSVTDATLSTSNITTNNVSTSKHGFAPILPNDASKFLDGSGNWTNPLSNAQNVYYQSGLYAHDDSTARLGGNAFLENVHFNGSNLYGLYLDSLFTVKSVDSMADKLITWNASTHKVEGMNWPTFGGGPNIYNVKASPYNAKGDGIERYTGVSTGSSTTFTDVNGTFTSADIGKIIVIDSAGTTNRQHVTTIAAVGSSTSITLTNAAVASYGACRYVYGSDNTTQIQAAIQAAYDAGGGTVWIPNGIYLLGGPLRTSFGGANPNSQLVIPSPTSSRDPNRPSTINIQGESGPNFIGNDAFNGTAYIPGKKGSVLLSTIDGSGAAASVIGAKGPSTSFNSFAYLDVTVKDLTILVPVNQRGTGPTIGGLNLAFVANVPLVENVFVSVDNTVFNEPNPTEDVAGIMIGQIQSETVETVHASAVVGFNYGIVPGEHTELNDAQVWACAHGIVLMGMNHSVHGTKIELFWNTYDVYVAQTTPTLGLLAGVTQGTINFSFDHVNIETIVRSKWFDNVANFKDSANIAIGTLKYNVVVSGVGPEGPFTKVGGNFVSCTPLYVKLNPQELIAPPFTTAYTGLGVATSDSAGILEINRGVTTATNKYFNTFLRTITQNGTNNLVARDIVVNKGFTGGGGNNRLFLTDYSTSNGTNNGVKIDYVTTGGALTQVDSVNGTQWTFTVPAKFAAPTTTTTSINLPSGTAKSSPATGDMFYDGTHLYFKPSGTIVDLLAGGGGGISGSGTSGQITVWNGSTSVTGSANLTFDATATDALAITGSNSARASLHLNASNAGSQAEIMVENNVGSLGAYGGFLTGGSSNSATLFGSSRANKTVLFSDGTSSSGLMVGALTSDPVIFGVNNTEVARFGTSGNFLIGTTTDNGSFLNLAAATTAKASLNLASGTAPTSPVAGDFWYNGTDIFTKPNGSSVNLTDQGSGSYSGTISSTTNISSSTFMNGYYIRKGNMVTVSVGLQVTPTAGATGTTFSVSLPPFTPNGSGNVNIGSGVVGDATHGWVPVIVNGATSTTVTCQFTSTAVVTGTQALNIVFTYTQ